MSFVALSRSGGGTNDIANQMGSVTPPPPLGGVVKNYHDWEVFEKLRKNCQLAQSLSSPRPQHQMSSVNQYEYVQSELCRAENYITFNRSGKKIYNKMRRKNIAQAENACFYVWTSPSTPEKFIVAKGRYIDTGPFTGKGIAIFLFFCSIGT